MKNFQINLLKLLACLLLPILITSCSNKNIIENPITGEKVLVAKNDLGEMNWYDAQNRCKELGDGWRLPTIDELKIMCKNYSKLDMSFNNIYFSSSFKISISEDNQIIVSSLVFANCAIQEFKYPTDPQELYHSDVYQYVKKKLFVRPVKTIK